MDICTTPVDEIEGIGPSISADLSELGIHQLCDFLYQTPTHLASISDFGIDRFERWRSSALLLELEGMDGQICEALVRKGVYDPEHLSILSLEEVMEKLREAHDEGMIPDLPTNDSVSGLQVAAARAHYGNQLSGKAIDGSGSPIEGVEIRVGGHSTVSNNKGVWRLTSLNTPPRVQLFAMKEGYGTLMMEDVELEQDNYSMELFELEMQAGASEEIVLDEYLGEDIGDLTDYDIEQVNLSADEIRESDILRVSHHYVNGDIKFTSMFMTRRNERLQVISFRVPGDQFTELPEMYSFWEVRSGALIVSSIDEGSLFISKAMHKDRVNRPAPEGPLTLEDFFGRPYSVTIQL